MSGSVRLEPGSAYPLGATWDGKGINFALFSAHAERVDLCVFDTSGTRELYRLSLPEYTDEVWHGYLPGFEPGTVYAYRVYGPYAPRSGHRFNHHKLLLDPYARCLVGNFRWTDAHYAYRLNDPRADMSFDERDNARDMYKAMVVADRPLASGFALGAGRSLNHWRDTVIYEAHVRGLTMQHPQVSPDARGSFAALAQPAVLEHLCSLGVSALELLPVQAFIDEHVLQRKGLRNYWGYNAIAFFAPMPRYLAAKSPGQAQIDEVRSAIQSLHQAGLEVFLDVVYNHTAEGNQLGPSFSFRGIDNLSYYHLSRNNHRFYENFTGCGNALNLGHPRVAAMVMDSLRYWVTQMQVDGFRFDLATTLAREADGFDSGAAFLDMLAQDPVLAPCKLIAEPWDVGPGGYRLGGFPPGWAEWNDQFRDTVRRFWRGDEGQLPLLAKRLHGSSDLFEHHGRRPHASINYVTSHDGFTLMDQVSYLEKHNDANGENNTDGHGANHSQNFDVEGHSDELGIVRARNRQRRNLLATLLLAEGTPMLLAGDEFGRTQRGNNNAYCQDNELSWVDWSGLGSNRDLCAFVAKLVRIRHESSVLRRDRFVHGAYRSALSGLADIAWYSADGVLMTESDWTDPGNCCLGMLRSADCYVPEPDGPDCPGIAQYEESEFHLGDPRGDEHVETVLVILNAAGNGIQFKLPEPTISQQLNWRCLMCSDEDMPVREPHDCPVLAPGSHLDVPASSIYVLDLIR